MKNHFNTKKYFINSFKYKKNAFSKGKKADRQADTQTHKSRRIFDCKMAQNLGQVLLKAHNRTKFSVRTAILNSCQE